MRGGNAIGGIGRKLTNPSSFSISRQPIIPFSTSSNSGGGRGRGRGGPLPPAPSLFNFLTEQFPGQPESQDSSSDLPGAGHGRGKPLPPFQPPPSFTSAARPTSSAGRGQPTAGSGDAGPKKPIFFKREDVPESVPETVMTDLNGSGRGTPIKPAVADVKTIEENRHTKLAPEGLEQKTEPRKPKLTREEAVKKALSVLEKGGADGPQMVDVGGRGRGMMTRGRGRGGRGRREGGDRRRQGDEDDNITSGLDLGDDADGERLAKRLGTELMNQLNEAFEEISEQVLPSPSDDAYVDALDTNCMIEFEPEYHMGEFNQNPDIDEQPPIPLRDALEKMKPFLIAYEGIQSQEEWEEVMEETMERVPLLKEIVDHYSGPDRITAKKQQEELERVAKTLPAKVPDSVKQFTDRAVLSLQSNPGWGFHRKCQFMDKLTEKVSKHYK